MYVDYQNLWKALDTRISWYRMNHKRELSSSSIASLVSRMLYEKRHFPYYAFNIVVGFDEENNNRPIVWDYDAVGSYGEHSYSVAGSSSPFFKTFLDNEILCYNFTEKPVEKDADSASRLLLDGFQSCCERDPQTGDKVKIVVLDAEGNVEEKEYDLRFD